MTRKSKGAEDHLFVFIDTNVFLHFAFFREVDWCTELQARSVTLVLPRVIIEELDRHKWDGTRRVKQRASSVLRALQALNLSAGPAPLRPGVTVDALDDEPDDSFLSHHRLRPDRGDDRLLGAALAFKATEPDARVVILSDDTGLGLRGPRRKVDVVSPGEHLRMPDEPDEIQRELEMARREIAAIRDAAPKLRLSFAEGPHLELEARLAGPLFDASTRQELLADWRKRHPLVQRMPDAFPMPDGLTFGLKALSAFGVPGLMSDEDARKHNEAIEFYFERYRKYLDLWPAMVNRLLRCIEINPVLENDGTVPADDVHLVLWTEAKGIWREKQPDIEKPPAMPKARSPYDINLPSFMSNIDVLGLRDLDDPIDGPNINGDDPTEVQYTVARVRHDAPCALPKVYFEFASDDDVGSFAIHYKLGAANVREPLAATLNVRITREAPVPPPNPDDVFASSDDDD